MLALSADGFSSPPSSHTWLLAFRWTETNKPLLLFTSNSHTANASELSLWGYLYLPLRVKSFPVTCMLAPWHRHRTERRCEDERKHDLTKNNYDEILRSRWKNCHRVHGSTQKITKIFSWYSITANSAHEAMRQIQKVESNLRSKLTSWLKVLDTKFSWIEEVNA